jgi:hypothetical protein
MINTGKETLFENTKKHNDIEVKKSIKNRPIIQLLGDDKSTNNNSSTTQNIHNNVEKDRPKKKQRSTNNEDDTKPPEHILQDANDIFTSENGPSTEKNIINLDQI